jgi:hypothetical protein
LDVGTALAWIVSVPAAVSGSYPGAQHSAHAAAVIASAEASPVPTRQTIGVSVASTPEMLSAQLYGAALPVQADVESVASPESTLL